MDFLDDKTLLVTERGGQLYRVDLMTGNRTTIGNVPQVRAARQGGLLDVAVWRDSAASPPSVYLCYSRPVNGGSVTAIDKAGFDGQTLTNRTTIFAANNPSESAIHYGCRLALDRSYLYASLGERGERDDAQDPALHAGAVIRLDHDGGVPVDNPKLPGWAPELFSKGHRTRKAWPSTPKPGGLDA